MSLLSKVRQWLRRRRVKGYRVVCRDPLTGSFANPEDVDTDEWKWDDRDDVPSAPGFKHRKNPPRSYSYTCVPVLSDHNAFDFDNALWTLDADPERVGFRKDLETVEEMLDRRKD